MELLAKAAAVALASKANAQSGVDPNTSAQDIVLWYDKPAARWADALPIGKLCGPRDGVRRRCGRCTCEGVFAGQRRHTLVGQTTGRK